MSKSIDVKVFTSNHKAFERFRFRPLTPGLEYSKEGINEVLTEFIAVLTKQYPENTFKVVPVGTREYNILPERSGEA